MHKMRVVSVVAGSLLIFIPALQAQDSLPLKPEPNPNVLQGPASGVKTAPQSKDPQQKPAPTSMHRFWDKTNGWLFASVAATRALDFNSTLYMRRRGNNEIFLNNETVDNHPAFAVIEAAATATSIGVSYLFHKTNHHKLERWTSIVHSTVTFSGAMRNYSLPDHRPPAGP